MTNSCSPIPPMDLRDVLSPCHEYLSHLARLLEPKGATEDEEFQAAREMLRECPELRAFGRRLVAAMDAAPGWTVLTGFPLSAYGKACRDVLLLCIGLALGIPTRTDCSQGRRIWEVTPRQFLPTGHVPTITECAGAAELHTDSQYRLKPERHVAILAVHPAEDGGGETTLLSADTLLDRLNDAPQGRHAYDVLRSSVFPFAVPASFTTDPDKGIPEFIQAPILAAQPMIRYRSDTLARGFTLAPLLATAEALTATSQLGKAIENHPATLQFRLHAGDVLLLDNHKMLHGRTDFTDPLRLLLRLRISASDCDLVV